MKGWKIGTAKRKVFEGSEGPGPASYSANNLKKSPTAVFGSSQRPDVSKANPGPGSYNFKGLADKDTTSKAPLGVIGKESRNAEFLRQTISDFPGPGNYTVGLRHGSPNYKFGSSNREGKAKQGPGPGDYREKDFVGKEGVRHSLSPKIKPRKKEITPGPSDYNYKFHPKKNSPNYGFTTDKRDRKNSANHPGPGSYNSREFVGNEGIRLTLYGRFPNKKKEQSPGPGDYTWNPEKRRSPSWVFGNAGKMTLNKTAYIPGPGSYPFSEVATEKSFSKKAPITIFPKAKRDQKIGYKPFPVGPGSYDSHAEVLKSKPPTYKIGTSKRHQLPKDIVNNPGPNSYSLSDVALKRSPGSKIGSEKRELYKFSANYPGPGSYAYKSRIGEGPKFGMSGGRQTFQNLKTISGVLLNSTRHERPKSAYNSFEQRQAKMINTNKHEKTVASRKMDKGKTAESSPSHEKGFVQKQGLAYNNNE